MKRVKLYKGFIPFKITEKRNSIIVRSNRRAIGFMLLINFILLPFNAINRKTSIVTTNEIIPKSENLDSNIHINDILKLITVYSENVKELSIENGVGKIISSDKDLLNNLEEKGFVINEIRYEESSTVIIFTN